MLCLVVGSPLHLAAQTKKPTRASLARATAAARAREAARARLLREVATPKFKTDILGNLVPDVRAAAAIVYNPQKIGRASCRGRGAVSGWAGKMRETGKRRDDT